jgi:nucleoside 2-deoxyribosyltransferase
MQSNKKLLIIGEVFTDVHLDYNPKTYRLGGIFHSARSLHSVGAQYALGAIAPSYLNEYIVKFGCELESSICEVIGEIKNVPNVMFIKESTEAGDQGYEDILWKQAKVEINSQALINMLTDFEPTDILLYPGKYNLLQLGELLKDCNARIHIDFQYESQYLERVTDSMKIDTIILSTSSGIFRKECNGDPTELLKYLEGRTESILLKENRGGSRYFNYSNGHWITAPAFLNETLHSVGVGDCYNSIFLTSDDNPDISMKVASYAASWYASTFDHKIYVSNVAKLYEIKEQINEMLGVRLGWEERAKHHIYIAGPDFPHIDTKWIQEVYDCLSYHNFIPHRPVEENGIIIGTEAENIQLETYIKDIKLLEQSSLLVAVILNDDPGTYVEIGWMARNGKPTILFDPYHKASNLFLKKTVTIVCNSIGEVINAVFELIGTEREEGLD